MKKILLPLIIVLFSCDVETPIEDNFVVEAFLFQGERVDDIKIKKTQKRYFSSKIKFMQF